MTKARDIASAAPAPAGVTSTELGYVDGVTSAIQTQIDSKPATASTVSTAGGSIISVASGTTVPLTIRNLGTGLTFVVEDETNPDSTPFTISAGGNVGVGTTSSGPKISIVAPAGGTSLSMTDGTNSTLSIKHESPGNLLTYETIGTATQRFITNSVERMSISGDGPVTINAVADATTTTAARGGGYMGIPQSAAATTGSYTIVAADAGEHIYSTATRTITIPANASVAFPVGTAISFVAATGATVTIAITSDTLLLAGPGTTGSRTLAPFGMATALKITSTSWIISGNGLT